jgi:glutamate 5-kinase
VLVPYLAKVSDDHLSHAQGKGSELSTGGMATKLKAANNVAKMGGIAAIVDGRDPINIYRALKGEQIGTVIGSQKAEKISKRKQWIAFFNRIQGTIIVDDGAKDALNAQRSLLPVGILSVKGPFGVGSLVQIEDRKANPIALGLTELASPDIEAIKGQSPGEEVIHRDNIWTQI